MKFIADAMLGRLAKWLRLLGFDVVYYPDMEDRQIIRTAREQERIVLTRDTGMMKQKGVRLIFIHADDIRGQLLELKDMLNLGSAEPLGRCVTCNGLLARVMHKDDVREQVPEFVYHTFSDFIKCEGCGKVYWKGTHYSRIKEKIKDLLSASPMKAAGNSAEGKL